MRTCQAAIMQAIRPMSRLAVLRQRMGSLAEGIPWNVNYDSDQVKAARASHMAKITQQHQEELLSLAYIIAVSSRAGVLFNEKLRHDYGIDGTFEKVGKLNGSYFPEGYPLDVQLKASINIAIDDSCVSYQLDANAHNNLLTRSNKPRATPCILVLLCLPRDPQHWLELSEEQFLLRQCSYWAKLKGELTSNTETKTIKIPRENQFTPLALIELLDLVEQGKF
jgi:Domain of unknown function (DUF4365)